VFEFARLGVKTAPCFNRLTIFPEWSIPVTWIEI
jgi:hypothetical protein